MHDIAARAGVSRSTVSCVLNGRRDGVWIGDETRERVHRAAAELGYRRNEMARAMVTGATRSLGFVTYLPGSEHVARMLEGALDEADAQGYEIQVLRPRNDEEFDRRLIERCVELRLAGVVVLYIQGATLERLHSELTRYGIPMALLDDNRHHPWGAPVVADYGQGMELAVRHLADLGHRRITLLVGPFSGAGRQARQEAFVAALTACGLPQTSDSVLDRAEDSHDTLQILRRKLSQIDTWPTALMADTDSTAMLALRAAALCELRVPEDLSVVGFGDLEMSRLANPPLTTVHQPFEAMGQIAVRRLLSAVAARQGGESALHSRELIPGRLVVRESTGPAHFEAM